LGKRRTARKVALMGASIKWTHYTAFKGDGSRVIAKTDALDSTSFVGWRKWASLPRRFLDDDTAD